jgi:hypothetical protein
VSPAADSAATRGYRTTQSGAVLTKKWHFVPGKHDDIAGSMLLFSGNANKVLAEEVASYLGVSLSGASVGMFTDGETAVRLEESVRGRDIFVMQPICSGAENASQQTINDALMEVRRGGRERERERETETETERQRQR